MRAGSAAKLIVDALLQRFLPLAKRRIETAQAQDGQYLQPSDPAYEQVLDSLAMIARHTPIPLLEALLKWRESESPKGANDAYTFQKKLAVECIFCSACIRFVECCPHDGLTEKLWNGLENFAFDWLINAERLVSQVDYPSLVDLRGLLLDLVAQFLGALSQIRFSSVTERFFMELSTRRIDTGVARAETLSIIHGIRYLKLGVMTEGALNASASFVAKANPLNRAPHKRKSELHHALCNMLSNILAPIADGRQGQWPPLGIDSALTLWYEAVARLRLQLTHWVEKQSKHINVGYPVISILLCLGDPQTFNNNFGAHMENLYKLFKEKNHRSVALECLHQVVRFYLRFYADSHPRDRVWDYVDSVASQLLNFLRKGLLTYDNQYDKLVEFCVTIARTNVDFAMNHMILELLRLDNLNEAKIIGLRALLAIVMSPSNRFTGLDFFRGYDIAHFIPKVRAAIESIIRSCHKSYSRALLTSSKTMIDAVSKEKSQGSLFHSVLKCIPHLIEEVGRNAKITEIIPQHGISVDPGVREEAWQVLHRMIKYLPHRRFAVIKGMANFIMQLPDEYPLLIQTSLGSMVDLMRLWRACLSEDVATPPNESTRILDGVPGQSVSVLHQSGDAVYFHASHIDAIGLLFLSSVDIQIRHTSLELLRCVRALNSDIRRVARQDYADSRSKNDAEAICIIDILEENGDDIVQSCYWDSRRLFDFKRDSDLVPPDVTLLSLLEGSEKIKWAICLSEVVRYACEFCPQSVPEARLEIFRRLACVTPVDLGGKAHQLQDCDSKVEQWLMYSMFVCACPPDSESDANFGTTKEIFYLIFPSLRSGSDSQTVG